MSQVKLDATKEVFLLMLKAMPIGLDVQTPNLKGHCKRVNRDTFVLFDNSNKDRSRWGTLEEMADDLAFFDANGHLPPADMPRW